MALLVSGCGDNPCVSADDWGYPKVYVPANGRGMGLSGEMAEQSVNGLAPTGSQVLLDVNLVELVVAIDEEDKWSAWLGGAVEGSWDNSTAPGANSGGMSDNAGSDLFNIESFLPASKECVYKLVDVGIYSDVLKYKKARSRSAVGVDFICPGANGAEPSNPDHYADCWVPCWFKDGVGLYVGLSPDGGSESDVVIAKHIPDPKHAEFAKVFDPNSGMPNFGSNDSETATGAYQREQDGFLIRGFASTEIPGALTGDALYFKIVDLFYEDNHGGYNVKIKSGTRSRAQGPLETVFEAFSRPIENLMERIFKGITGNPEYIRLVQAFLALYIMFFGYAYLMGMVEKPKIEFITKVIKFALIIQLIDPSSWDFFYNNFFGAFVEGALEIAAMVSTPFPDYDPSSPWFSLDEVLRKFGSAETAAKVGSTLFTNASGFLFIVVFYIALGLVVITLLKSLMVYLVSYIGIAFLVMLAPIFIIFVLFEKTKGLFDDWVNHFLSFAIQQIVLFAALGMFSALLYHYLTQTVGYRVCWETWFELNLLGYSIVDLKYWFPSIRELQTDLWMDWGLGTMQFYTEYRIEAVGSPSLWPFVDLPYFDPVKELARIRTYQSEKDFLSWGDVFVFIAAIFFMFKFMSFVPTLANSLKSAGGGAGTADAFRGGNQLWGSALSVTASSLSLAKGAVGNFSIGERKFGVSAGEVVIDRKGNPVLDSYGNQIKTTSVTAFGIKWSGGALGVFDSSRQAWNGAKSMAKGVGNTLVQDALDIKKAATGKSSKSSDDSAGGGSSAADGAGKANLNKISDSHIDKHEVALHTLVDVAAMTKEGKDRVKELEEARNNDKLKDDKGSDDKTEPNTVSRQPITGDSAELDKQEERKKYFKDVAVADNLALAELLAKMDLVSREEGAALFEEHYEADKLNKKDMMDRESADLYESAQAEIRKENDDKSSAKILVLQEETAKTLASCVSLAEENKERCDREAKRCADIAAKEAADYPESHSAAYAAERAATAVANAAEAATQVTVAAEEYAAAEAAAAEGRAAAAAKITPADQAAAAAAAEKTAAAAAAADKAASDQAAAAAAVEKTASDQAAAAAAVEKTASDQAAAAAAAVEKTAADQASAKEAAEAVKEAAEAAKEAAAAKEVAAAEKAAEKAAAAEAAAAKEAAAASDQAAADKAAADQAADDKAKATAAAADDKAKAKADKKAGLESQISNLEGQLSQTDDANKKAALQSEINTLKGSLSG